MLTTSGLVTKGYITLCGWGKYLRHVDNYRFGDKGYITLCGLGKYLSHVDNFRFGDKGLYNPLRVGEIRRARG
jgi:hypothetical protein